MIQTTNGSNFLSSHSGQQVLFPATPSFYGWICPNCKIGISPSVSACPQCIQAGVAYSYGQGSILDEEAANKAYQASYAAAQAQQDSTVQKPEIFPVPEGVANQPEPWQGYPGYNHQMAYEIKADNASWPTCGKGQEFKW